MARANGRLGSETTDGRIAWEFLAEWLTPLRVELGFSSTMGQASWWRPSPGVLLQPTVQFGQPCIERTRIPTSAIWGYVNAGDAPAYLTKAYGVGIEEIERAVEWEKWVRAALEPTAALST